MKLFKVSCLLLLLTLLGQANCFPPIPEPPQSVLEGEDGIKDIWLSARAGSISNHLPWEYAHLQGPWERFLRTTGEVIVDRYYKQVFRGYINKAVIHGSTRFTDLVRFTSTRPYTFDPLRWKAKQEVALLLAETFAQQQYEIGLARAAEKSYKESFEKNLEENRFRESIQKNFEENRAHEAADVSAAVDAHQSAQLDQERKEWGRTLSLGRGDGPSNP